MWCDANSIATDVVIDTDGVGWKCSMIKKKVDYNHINVDELDVMLNGINLLKGRKSKEWPKIGLDQLVNWPYPEHPWCR